MTEHRQDDVAELLRAVVPDLVAPPDRLTAISQRVRRRRWNTMSVTAAAVLVIAAGTGLWLRPPDSAPPVASPQPLADVACRDNDQPEIQGRSLPPRQPLDERFVPVAALRCTIEFRVYPGEGEYELVVEQRATRGLENLARELRKPPVLPGGYGCADVGLAAPWFVLADESGRMVVPSVQDDWCNGTKYAVRRELEKVPWTITSERRIHQTRTEAQLRMDCRPRELKDPFADARVDASAARFEFPRSSAGLRACLYAKTSTTASVGAIQKGDGLLLPERDAVLARLRAGGAPTPCQARATTFVILRPSDPNVAEIAVELDGCGRISSAGRLLGQLTDNQRDEMKAVLETAMPY